MKGAIASTKREIATLRRSEDDGGGMRRAAGELDAVIEATEDATTTILAAAEEIESHATMLRAAGVATGNNDCVGAILDRTVALYEACNFQDLTGQRITKIVGVLKFVEERLDRMIGVWGGLDAFKELAGEQRHERAPRGARAPQRAEARGRRRPRHPGRHRRALQLKRWRVGYSAGAASARPGAKRSRAMVRSAAMSKR